MKTAMEMAQAGAKKVGDTIRTFENGNFLTARKVTTVIDRVEFDYNKKASRPTVTVTYYASGCRPQKSIFYDEEMEAEFKSVNYALDASDLVYLGINED